MKFINLTPHQIKVLDAEGNVDTIIESTGEARCEQIDGEPKQVGGFTVKPRSYGNVTGLPAPDPQGAIFIVSQIVAQACPDRYDLVWPGDVKRENGNIIGCYNFCCVQK